MQETSRLATPRDLFQFFNPRRGGRNFLTRFLIQTLFLFLIPPQDFFAFLRWKFESRIQKMILEFLNSTGKTRRLAGSLEISA